MQKIIIFNGRLLVINIKLGHSERRQYNNETDDVSAKKAERILKSGLKVIFCIGEKLEQRESNQTFDIVS